MLEYAKTDNPVNTALAQNPADYALNAGLAGIMLPGRNLEKRPAVKFAHHPGGRTPPGELKNWLYEFRDSPAWNLRCGRVRCPQTGRTGWLVVVDCDTPQAVRLAGEILPPTDWEVITPSGGRHKYYIAGAGFRLRQRRGRAGLDVQAGGNSIVVAPHSDCGNGPYRPTSLWGYGEIPILELPTLQRLESALPARRVPPPLRREPRSNNVMVAHLLVAEHLAYKQYQARQAQAAMPPPEKEGSRLESDYVMIVTSRRLYRNFWQGDDRTTPTAMLPYVTEVCRRHFGDVQNLPFDMDEMLIRACGNAARDWTPGGFYESQKRHSNDAHDVRAELRKPGYAALESEYHTQKAAAAAAGVRFRVDMAAMQAVSGAHRTDIDGNPNPYSVRHLRRIIANDFEYQAPRAELPADHIAQKVAERRERMAEFGEMAHELPSKRDIALHRPPDAERKKMTPLSRSGPAADSGGAGGVGNARSIGHQTPPDVSTGHHARVKLTPPPQNGHHARVNLTPPDVSTGHHARVNLTPPPEKMTPPTYHADDTLPARYHRHARHQQNDADKRRQLERRRLEQLALLKLIAAAAAQAGFRDSTPYMVSPAFERDEPALRKRIADATLDELRTLANA